MMTHMIKYIYLEIIHIHYVLSLKMKDITVGYQGVQLKHIAWLRVVYHIRYGIVDIVVLSCFC